MQLIPLLHIALCGAVTGALIVRGPRPLAVALAVVLGLSIGALTYPHVAWHVLAPFACLAGVAQTCERREFFPVVIIGCIWALAVTYCDFSRLETGYLIAGAHLFAFTYGRHCFKNRKKLSKYAAWRVGVVIASCAAGAVGAVLWAHGLSTEPAQWSDIILFCVLVVLSAW